MESRWSEEKANEFKARYSSKWGEDLALRAYSTRLLGAEKSLVLHGGGNTSVKAIHKNLFGEPVPAIFVKASGFDMATIEPEEHSGLDLEYLVKLRRLPELSNRQMTNEFRTHLFDCNSATPSIETLVHAFLPRKFIDHTHADAVLALTNQLDGGEKVREALGDDVIILKYVKPGFKLAKAAVEAYEAHPAAIGMVWMHHGLVTWGDAAHESYSRMLELVSRAEQYLDLHATHPPKVLCSTPLPQAEQRAIQVAPILRGLLSLPNPAPDSHSHRVILQSLVSRQVLDFLNSEGAKGLALSPTLTSDHLIRTKALPLWIDSPRYDDLEALRGQLSNAIGDYSKNYKAYLERYAARMEPGVAPLDPLPRVVLMPGLGAFCAGKDLAASNIVRDITAQTIETKTRVAAMGTYRGLSEDHLFEMEYDLFQHSKLARAAESPLGGQVAIVTGAAGAIGSGICRGLLEQGAAVALADLPGVPLESLVSELRSSYGDRALGLSMDVTDPHKVTQGFDQIIRTWGGLDLVIINAGVALVSSLAEMSLESFQRLERVNIEGTLLMLAESARHFKRQGSGGDIVLISTKNVFAPGAKFGAYSATKAAAHQLARIASLELAEIGVRVNMVAPDGVFGEGVRKSGLWAEVGPDRMKARGLDEKGLEEYYQNRNLLKARITPRHVANAVLYFVTRQTPTTGATLPVDGGLPDATPR